MDHGISEQRDEENKSLKICDGEGTEEERKKGEGRILPRSSSINSFLFFLNRNIGN